MPFHKPAPPARPGFHTPAPQAKPAFHKPVPQDVASFHNPVPEQHYDWHPGNPGEPAEVQSGFPAWADGFERYSEEYWLQLTEGAFIANGGEALGALVGAGPDVYLVVKNARETRPAGTTITTTVKTDDVASGGRAMAMERRSDPTLNYLPAAWGVESGFTRPNNAVKGWGPEVLLFGRDAANVYYGKSSAHVPVYEASAAFVTNSGWTDLEIGSSDANAAAPDAFVSITVLTTKPTTPELNAFSKKGAMAWDIWPAADIFTHYHVGSLEDVGDNWVLKPWSGQAGPQVDMVLGSAVSDANLTQWTEPKIAWPTEPKALMTGNLVSGAGVRHLDMAAGRVMGGADAFETWFKGSQTVDSANLRTHCALYVDEADSFTSRIRNHNAGMRTDGFAAATGSLSGATSAGPWTVDAVSAVGHGVKAGDSVRNNYIAGVKVSGLSVAGYTNAQGTRLMLSAESSSSGGVGSNGANHLMQEALTLNRISVGDEWLTYSNNLGVDPRLIFGMEGIDSGGALQHVWSMAYLDIATQKVPDIHDDQDLADALDVQGDPATAAQILPIGEDGKPVYSSFSADYSADYNQ